MTDTTWEDARRMEAWAGEVRVNLIRCVALVLFYGNHLLYVYLASEVSPRDRFHAAVTAVVLAWAIGILVLHTCLSRRWVPAGLKYLVTAWDLLLITTLVLVSPEGPHSSLMLLYFVVIAAAPLRLSLPLVWVSTFGALLCALIVLGQYILIRVGWTTYFAPDMKTTRIPWVSEVLYGMALGAVGLLAGQMVRQARRLVQGYPVRVQTEKEPV